MAALYPARIVLRSSDTLWNGPSAVETPEAIRLLHERFDRFWDSEPIDRLLLIAAYVLDFLCIHPFVDGNGRMARLLTLLLLYRGEFEVGRYISLKMLVEDSRVDYYKSLGSCSEGWHIGEHSLIPWWNYFLGALLKAHREFEARVSLFEGVTKSDMVVEAIGKLPDPFTRAQLAAACPGVSKATVDRMLAKLKESGSIFLTGVGRGSRWEKVIVNAEWVK